MTSEELSEKLNEIQILKCETEIYEYKKASEGCPKKLYDTLSSFSNQDEIRAVPRATFGMLDAELLDLYVRKLKNDKPNFGSLDIENIYELVNITRNNEITLSTLLLFGLYPQAYFPQLCITAVVVPGTEIGETGELGERFLDNKRIEGNIETMLKEALNFIRKNMRNKTIISPITGEREDTYDYPLTAIREAILNALVHRDYSVYTERTPIQIIMYEDRLEIISPGQIYGRIRTEQLGKTHPDTRNPSLASALEILCITENRYSGIPTMRREMKKQGLSEPEFIEQRGTFTVKFYRDKAYYSDRVYHDDMPLSFVCESSEYYAPSKKNTSNDLIAFCKTPRTRQEICKFLGISSVSYVIREKVMPLVKEGKLHLTIPDKPKSAHQLYYS